MKTPLLSISLILSAFVSVGEGLNRLYPVIQEANDDVKTTQVIENTALGQCTCDVTLNSCDLYCCCDEECDAN